MNKLILPLLSSSKVSSTVAGLLILMFSYAAFSKLVDYEDSKKAMLNQVFSDGIALQLVWLVPLTELIIVILLLLNNTRLQGFNASAILMTGFTLYIAFSMSGAFGRIPCSCGGILSRLGYGTHLLFNLFFLSLSIIGIVCEERCLNHQRLHLKKKGGNQEIE